MTIAARLEKWTGAVAAAGPELDAEGREIAVRTYRLLALGKPVSVSDIAGVTGLTVDGVEKSLRSWPLVFWDDQDRVIGFWGLAIDPLERTHAIEVQDETLYGWCAWDTLFVTEILGTETRVKSTDPNNKTTVELVVSPDRVISVTQAGRRFRFCSPTESSDPTQSSVSAIASISSPQPSRQENGSATIPTCSRSPSMRPSNWDASPTG